MRLISWRDSKASEPKRGGIANPFCSHAIDLQTYGDRQLESNEGRAQETPDVQDSEDRQNPNNGAASYEGSRDSPTSNNQQLRTLSTLPSAKGANQQHPARPPKGKRWARSDCGPELVADNMDSRGNSPDAELGNAKREKEDLEARLRDTALRLSNMAARSPGLERLSFLASEAITELGALHDIIPEDTPEIEEHRVRHGMMLERFNAEAAEVPKESQPVEQINTTVPPKSRPSLKPRESLHHWSEGEAVRTSLCTTAKNPYGWMG